MKGKNKEIDIILCDKCRVNPAEEDHTCPYGEDIHNDYETVCNCCEQCQIPKG